MFFFGALILIFPVLAIRLAGNSISDMTYLVSSGTLNLNSLNQWSKKVAYAKHCQTDRQMTNSLRHLISNVLYKFIHFQIKENIHI